MDILNKHEQGYKMKNENKKLQKAVSDKRYSLSLEFTGKEDPQIVARFCDHFIGSYARGDTVSAILGCCIHQGERLNIL